MNKSKLRKEMKKKRNQLSENEIILLSKSIFTKITSSDDYKSSNTIFVFVSFSSEIYTHDFIKEALKEGKNICIPYIDEEKNIMSAVELTNFDDLELGYYNILSLPENKIRYIDPATIDLILVPGLIFGKNYYRIGYGGGYYDKFMSNPKVDANKIGLCFDFQLIDKVDFNEYDIPVDKIYTELQQIERINK